MRHVLADKFNWVAESEGKDLIHVLNNIKPTLHLTASRDVNGIDLPLAKTDAHARWIEWTANAIRPE